MKLITITLISLFATITSYAASTAQAKMEGRSGSAVTGTIDFSQMESALKIEYKLSGLKPNSTFGFHVHEKGDCSAYDAKSAGSHFHKIADTGGTSKETPGAYAGDLPQISSDARGIAQGSVTSDKLSLGKAQSVDGLAIMVHAGPDDVNKPSTPRIACGVIKTVKK